MKEYVIDANNMDEKELNRTIKEQAPSYDRLIINNPESRHNICAGLCEDVEIQINGSAGYFVGTMVNGPRIHINGNAGGTVMIGGNSGFMTGLLMMGGRLIILGDVTDDVGESIMRGSIYVLGDVKSLGKNAVMEKTTPKDLSELKEILTQYGFELTDDDYTNFKKIVNIQ